VLFRSIALNHAPAYIERIASTAGMGPMSLDPDTGTSAGSWDAARLAVGAVLDGLDMIMEDKADNGFALVRPPGHHAESARAMGFCLFNNAAIGAHYLISKYRLQRVLVIDWDIHHGNGTQHAFYSSPHVLYFSTHQYPYYPGTGAYEEVGEGEGRGFTVNVPLPGGQGDKDYASIFKQILVPLAQQYRPEFIIVSAGYDIYQLDPLGTMDVTPQGFHLMAGIVKQMADALCGGRLLCTLEGGYHVKGLTESVKQTLLALCSDSSNDDVFADCTPAVRSTLHSIIAHVKKVHAFAWPLFRQ
jgi:acetoin utilization deacetylase AcuC-like enzyme